MCFIMTYWQKDKLCLADSEVPIHINLGFTKRLLEALLVPIYMYAAHSMNA